MVGGANFATICQVVRGILVRVCLISREFPPDTGWGGIGTFMYDLALGLAECGHEVEVVSLATGEPSTQKHSGITVHRVLADEELERFQLVLTLLPYSHSILKQLSSLYQKFLQLHNERPFDVVETPEMFGEGIFVGTAKIAPLVVRLHTPHFKFIDEKLHLIDDSFDHRLLAIQEQLAIMQADAVTCPSEDLAKYVAAKTGYPLKAISIIRNHVDTRKFTQEGTHLIEKKNEKVSIVFVGRLEERKGVYVLADAIPSVVKRFPSAHFYLVGKDTNTAEFGKSVREELKVKLANSDCADNVTFTGPVPHAEMPSVYRSADVCVLPSLYENAPITCIEAMATGVAVVSTSAGGTKEYLDDGETGFIVEPGKAEPLADAIIRLLENPELRDSMARKARSKCEQKYDRREIARQSHLLYEDACQSFINSRKYALYKKTNEEVVPEFYETLASVERQIFKHTYSNSFLFRVKYWWRMICARPRLGSAGLFVEIARATATMLRLEKVEKSLGEVRCKLGTAPEKTWAMKD